MPMLLVAGSQANETLYDVFPVERRFNGFVGAFESPPRDDANAGEPGAAIDEVEGSVASRHAGATIRIDPTRAHEIACRSADMNASVMTKF